MWKEPENMGVSGWREAAPAGCGGRRRREKKHHCHTHCQRGRDFPWVSGSPGGEGWNSTNGGSWERGNQCRDPDPVTGYSPEEKHSRFMCKWLCRTSAWLRAFCQWAGAAWSAARELLSHRHTDTCSSCKACAHTLTLSSFSWLHYLFFPFILEIKSLLLQKNFHTLLIIGKLELFRG